MLEACPLLIKSQTYPLDVAKTVYQKAHLTNVTNKAVPVPSVQWFKKSTYNGMYIPLFDRTMSLTTSRSCSVLRPLCCNQHGVLPHLRATQDEY